MRGRELEVLVEGKSDESEYVLMGRHEGQAPEIDGQVYLTLTGEARPSPGRLRAGAGHPLGEYDLAAEVVDATTPARSSSASPGRRPPVRLPVL
jgi:ribosomal protein S12 methylthiotransferase